ncbi:MAG: ABC transporter ATP-binding protein/permease [Candidatus Izemoplasmatales bacterium]
MLKLVNVSKYYSSNNVIALGLRKVNLEFRQNEFVAIVGESGSGKTTLLNVLCGIDTYEEGEMYLNGEETSYFSVADMENFRKKYVAFVFQNYNLIDSYTVLQNVEAPLILAGVPKTEIRPRAMDIIRRVGLEKHIHHKSTKLSGGQKQRVVIARALAKNAPIIAADEPTGNLDSVSAKQIIELLHEIAKDKLVIVVTHDYDQVKDYATRKIRIFDGEIVEDVEVRPTAKRDLPKIADAETRLSPTNHLGIALRNLLAVPRKSILMILVFAVFSFFVALAYGAFNASMRDYEDWGNYYFTNTSITRVVVRKADRTAFTPEDLASLLEVANVKLYVENDFILDYALGYQALVANEWGYYDYLNPYPLPLGLVTAETLYAGRMPEAADEVVLATNELYLDDYVDTYLGKDLAVATGREWGTASDDRVTVVGLVSSEALDVSAGYYSDFILLDDVSLADVTAYVYLAGGFAASTFTGTDNLGDPFTLSGIFNQYTLELDETVPLDTVYAPYYASSCDPDEDVCEADGTLTIADFYRTETFSDIHFEYVPAQIDGKYTMRIHPATAEALLGDGVFQVSAFTESDVGVDWTIRSIGAIRDGVLEPKFAVFYPYDSQSGEEYARFFVLLNILSAGFFLFFTLAGATLITYVIFRAIINTKMHDYAIYRTIGASRRMITAFIYLENVFTAVVAYAIVAGTLIALNTQETFLTEVIKYYNVGTYLILFGILIGMALLISGKYCRRVFGESVQRTLKAE